MMKMSVKHLVRSCLEMKIQKHENQQPTDQEQVEAFDGQSMDLALTVHDWGIRAAEVIMDLSRALISDPQPRPMGPINDV